MFFESSFGARTIHKTKASHNRSLFGGRKINFFDNESNNKTLLKLAEYRLISDNSV